MYHNDVTKIPASWAETEDAQAKSRTANRFTNGDSHANGYGNGDSNGYTNGRANGGKALPDAFLEGKSVRTVYGLVSLKYALDWPIFASYDELSGCATWMGGRIPTFEEARSIYTYVGAMKKAEAERKLGRTVPAVNG